MSASELVTNVNTIWVLVCTVLVLLMQPGFACLEMGLVRAKNTINVAIKNVADFCIAALLFWIAGYGIIFGVTQAGWIGGSHFLFDPAAGPDPAPWMTTFFFFQLAFCGASTTIVSGAVAERMSFRGYFICAAVLSALIYPLFGHWAWGGLALRQAGWLQELGFVDFAGSTVVHSIGGWVALAAILILGPRIGRFGPNGKAIEPHNPSIAVLGMFLLWVGWFGFNGGSELALTARVPGIMIHTLLAAAAGGIAVLLYTWIRRGRPGAMDTVNGVLAGLVAITAGAHATHILSACVIGAVGGLVCLWAAQLLVRLEIDDTVGAVPVHLAAGIWGTLAVALLGDSALWGTGLSRMEQLGVQALGVGAAAVVGFGIAWPVLRLIDSALPLRVPAKSERIGLNTAEHGASTALIDLVWAMEMQRRTGDFGGEVHVEPFTEAGDIAAQYNMVLRKFNDEVAKRETTARDLREARDQAELANASKSQFLANMSHELRTPLNAIIGFSEVIRDELFGRLNNDRYKDYAADINSSSQHLLALINDILDLSKIEANKFELYEEDVDVAEVIAACDRMLRGRAEQHGVTLDVRVEPGLPGLRADARALRQMILNLMSNAVKFTPESGNVALCAGLEPDGRIALTVSDTGIGISKENLARALQPFTQIAEDNLVYAAEGTGLGLPLTAALARLHGGSLVIESVKGEGTTIVVRFPQNRIVREEDRLSA